MKRRVVRIDELHIVEALTRSSRSKKFEDHLLASIDQGGLAEPIKVARSPRGRYEVVDGVMRVRAMRRIRESHPERFKEVQVDEVPYEQRFEIRYQSDIYQDLLPSQLARLVEYLHESEGVSKKDIARYIGVSAPTLRNYTGLFRLVERGGLFRLVVQLMDNGIIPASNPFAWLRLTTEGIRLVLERFFTSGMKPETWAKEVMSLPNQPRFPTKFVEEATGSLSSDLYRKGQDVRNQKRDLGLRRAAKGKKDAEARMRRQLRVARQHLSMVATDTSNEVLRHAAVALSGNLGL